MKAWIFQDPKQVKKVGVQQASWCVGWYDPQGHQRSKSCGSGTRGHRNAEKLQRKIEGELTAGTYQGHVRKSWSDYLKDYESKVLDRMDSSSRSVAKQSLNTFARIIKPKRMSAIVTATIAEFTAKRCKERGRKKKSVISKATVNKDLRHLRAAIRKAYKWGYISKLPEFEFLKEVKKLPTYVTPEDFAKLYTACDKATEPHVPNIEAADWWRGLLITAYMTGWRIGELLALRREDLDLDAGTAVTRGEVNKGRRDAVVPLHPLVVEHLKKLTSFGRHVFPWTLNGRHLYSQFYAIQKAAKVKRGEGFYGFHDLRRAFGTMNADRMSADALQALMRHQSYTTTQRYINMARQLKPAAENLFVPDLTIKKEAKEK